VDSSALPSSALSFGTLAPEPDGTILAPFQIETAGEGSPNLFIARFGEDGSLKGSIVTRTDGYPTYLLAEPSGDLVLGDSVTLWSLNPAGEPLLRMPLRTTYSDFASLSFLGVRKNYALLHDHTFTGMGPRTNRVWNIPLRSAPKTAIGIEPNDNAEWRNLTQIPQLPTSALEGREKRVRIQRRGDVRQPAAVTVSTRDVTAQAGRDYIPTSVRLEFQSFEAEKTMPISVLADDEREPEETFEVVLSDPSGAEAIAPPMRIRILNDVEPVRLNKLRRLSANEVQITYYWQHQEDVWLLWTELNHKLQWSEDLRTWTNLGAKAYPISEYELGFVDRHPISAKARFYRLWTQ